MAGSVSQEGVSPSPEQTRSVRNASVTPFRPEAEKSWPNWQIEFKSVAVILACKTLCLYWLCKSSGPLTGQQ